jgi:hypothetical protein
VADCLDNVGSLTSHNPIGLRSPKLVMGTALVRYILLNLETEVFCHLEVCHSSPVIVIALHMLLNAKDRKVVNVWNCTSYINIP